MWQFDVLVLGLVSIYFPFMFFNIMAVILDSSPESSPKSCWVVATILCFPLLLGFFGLISGCNFQQWVSSWPYFEQCLKTTFSPSFEIDAFFFLLPFEVFTFLLPLKRFFLPSSKKNFPLASRCVDEHILHLDLWG